MITLTSQMSTCNSGHLDSVPLLQELLTKPYRGQIIVAPHTYPPAISKVHAWMLEAAGALVHKRHIQCQNDLQLSI